MRAGSPTPSGAATGPGGHTIDTRARAAQSSAVTRLSSSAWASTTPPQRRANFGTELGGWIPVTTISHDASTSSSRASSRAASPAAQRDRGTSRSASLTPSTTTTAS